MSSLPPPVSTVTTHARERAERLTPEERRTLLHSWRSLSPNELRARRHAVYTFLIEHCLERVSGNLFQAPSAVAEIVLTGEVAKAFDYDLRGVPGFFFPEGRDFWKLNTRPRTYLEPYFDGGLVAGFYVRTSPASSQTTLLTSKGLPLGTEATKPL